MSKAQEYDAVSLYDSESDCYRQGKTGACADELSGDVENGDRIWGNNKVTIEMEQKKNILYGVNETPRWYLVILYALQQSLSPLSSNMSVTLLVAEFICAHDDETLKTKLICTSMVMAGLCTLLQCSIGIRIPLYQGPTAAYVVPLLGMMSLKEFSCELENGDSILGINGTLNAETKKMILEEKKMLKLQMMSGSLLLAGAIHAIIGATGIVGILVRYIGPVTIVPTITLVGLYIYKALIRFSEPQWGISIFTVSMGLVLSLYLSKKSTPLLGWNKRQGCHSFRFPLHVTLSLLFCIIISWILCAILTVTDVFPNDPSVKEYYARTDSRSHVIGSFNWFYLPHPTQFGPISFHSGIFTGFLISTFISIIDSIGDYYACANTCEAPLPPIHAINRGIFVEGFCSSLCGLLGAGHSTTTYGGNIGNIGITKVASRRVFQVVGIVYIVFGIIGKIGAFFISIPYPVLGGMQIISFGIFIGVVLSNLRYIDLNSTRNTAIIGISLLFGLMIPYFIENNPDSIETGISELSSTLRVMLSNPTFVGGVMACFMDNTVPGTLKERGLTTWLPDLNESKEEKKLLMASSDSDEIEKHVNKLEAFYGFPFLPKSVRGSRLFHLLPFLPSFPVHKKNGADASSRSTAENRSVSYSSLTEKGPR